MKCYLQQVLKDNTIKAEVAEEALDHDDSQIFIKTYYNTAASVAWLVI